MEQPPEFKTEIIGVRHLEDEEALMTYGFDTPLKKGQETIITEIGNTIIEDSEKLGKEKISFIFSTQKRTSSTATLVRDAMLSKKENLDISLEPDARLTDLDQGRILFPENYKDGDHLPALPKAWDIFWEESFNKKNLLYRFGDSVKQANGTYLYPELNPTFDKPGESCAEFTYRLYDFLSSLEHRDYAQTLNVIIGHTATVFIMHEFLEIAEDLSKLPVPHIPLGELPALSWTYLDKVRKYLPSKLPHGNVSTYEVSNLIKPEIQEIIRIERDALKAMMVQNQR